MGDKPPDGQRRWSGRALQDRGPVSAGSCSWTSAPSSISPSDVEDKSLGANLLAQLIAASPTGRSRRLSPPPGPRRDGRRRHARRGRSSPKLIQAASDKEAIPFLSLLKARTATLTADFDKTARGQFTLTFRGRRDREASRAGPGRGDQVPAHPVERGSCLPRGRVGEDRCRLDARGHEEREGRGGRDERQLPRRTCPSRTNWRSSSRCCRRTLACSRPTPARSTT